MMLAEPTVSRRTRPLNKNMRLAFGLADRVTEAIVLRFASPLAISVADPIEVQHDVSGCLKCGVFGITVQEAVAYLVSRDIYEKVPGFPRMIRRVPPIRVCPEGRR